MSRVLVFSDTHYPFSIKGYEDFLYEVYKKYHCDTGALWRLSGLPRAV